MYIAEPDQTRVGTEPTIEGQVVALRQSVSSGQVSLSPEAGEQLRKMLTEQLDQVDVWLSHANGVERRAPLGTNPVGDAMSAKFELRATGDPLSFLSVMTAYRDVLRQTLDAVTSAIRSVQQVDTDRGAAFAAVDC